MMHLLFDIQLAGANYSLWEIPRIKGAHGYVLKVESRYVIQTPTYRRFLTLLDSVMFFRYQFPLNTRTVVIRGKQVAPYIAFPRSN